MGQAIRGLPETPALSSGDRAPSPEPVGRWLARERRLRGLSLDDVAAATRIPRRSLERLEAGAFDSSPDGFSRGFVRAVADAIGLDASEALARLLGEASPARRRRGGPPRWLLLLAAAAILGGVLTLSLPVLRSGEPAAEPVEATAPGAAPADAQPRRRDFVRELAAQVRAGSPPRRDPGAGAPSAP